MKSTLLSVSAWLLLAAVVPANAAQVDISNYTDLGGGRLSLEMTVEYLYVFHGGKPKDAPTYQKRYDQIYEHLIRLQAKYKHPAPYTTKEILALYSASTPESEYEKLPRSVKVPILTEPKIHIERTLRPSAGPERVESIRSVPEKLRADHELEKLRESDPKIRSFDAYRSSIGPLRIRRTTADIDPRSSAIEVSGPDPAIGKAKGAKLNFSDNRLQDGNGAWSTEGTVYLPLHWSWEPLPEDKSQQEMRLHVFPAVSWKVQEQQTGNLKDVNELKFAVPFSVDQGGVGDFWTFVGEPYYHTDTHFDGGIWGSELSIAYRGDILWNPVERRPFHLNRWDRFGDVDVLVSGKGLLDYSDVHQASRYMDRAEGDDWFRLGLEAGIEFGFLGKPNEGRGESPLVLGASYRFMETLAGDGGYSDLFSAHLTYWMTKYIGLTLEYQQGETPVADKEIDLISLGLEFRY